MANNGNKNKAPLEGETPQAGTGVAEQANAGAGARPGGDAPGTAAQKPENFASPASQPGLSQSGSSQSGSGQPGSVDAGQSAGLEVPSALAAGFAGQVRPSTTASGKTISSIPSSARPGAMGPGSMVPGAMPPGMAPGAMPGQPAQPAQPQVVAPDPADIEYEQPLIQCLSMLFKWHGRPVSPKVIAAGVPTNDGPLHPSACIRAARSVGLQAKTVYRPTLRQISSLTLPCIILLQNDNACVLLKIEGDTADVMFPENSNEVRTVLTEELEKEYTGYAIFAKPEAKLDKRASGIKLVDKEKWFWGTLRHFMPIYKHVVGASIVVNLLTMCSPLFFMNVYDRVVPNNATATLWMLALGIGISYIFDFMLRNLRSYFVDVAGRNADIILASRLMTQLLSLRLDAKPESTGSLVNNLREFESLRDFFGSTTLLALVDLPFLVIFIVIVGILGGPLVIVPTVAVPIIICAGIFLQRPMQQIAEKGFKENMQKNALLVEIVNGLETVKTTQAESRMQSIWEKVVGMSALSNCHNKRMANLSVTITILTTQLVSVFVIIWGVYLINDKTLSMGGLIASNMLAGRAMAPLSQVASMLSRLQQSRMALKSLDQLMKMPTERTPDDSYVEFGQLEHSLGLESVSFKYPNSQRFSLENVNIHINPGEKVGIIGRMGSGKSTFGRLCVGLFQPTEGAVRMGGVDVRQMDTVTLRSRIGYVSQDNYLFYGTVRENISFGTVNADDRMILRAANIAGVTDFVRGHPAGFGMQVGERGMSLSGGQRQSVAIARALLRDPDIIILDEPSSNMDNSSELALKQRLAATMGNKTLILITHRMSMLDLVDRLVVMDGGRIVADGPKNAVLNALRNEQVRAAQSPYARRVAQAAANAEQNKGPAPQPGPAGA